MPQPREWYTCDDSQGTCLYTGRSINRLKSDPPRCIKHGSPLFYQSYYNGWTREQIRKDLDGDQSFRVFGR